MKAKPLRCCKVHMGLEKKLKTGKVKDQGSILCRKQLHVLSCELAGWWCFRRMAFIHHCTAVSRTSRVGLRTHCHVQHTELSKNRPQPLSFIETPESQDTVAGTAMPHARTSSWNVCLYSFEGQTLLHKFYTNKILMVFITIIK